MVTLFEFLSDEPIDNVITCMNYRVNRVIFFGNQVMFNRLAKQMEYFLAEKCGMDRDNIRFIALPSKDLQKMLAEMQSTIEKEWKEGNRIYFDITGGDSLARVAFGKLSDRFRAPIHLFDVSSGHIIELDEGATDVISRDVEKRTVRLTLSDLIRLHGGVINSRMDEGYKQFSDAAAADIEKIWKVASANWKYWNPFSMFLRENMNLDDSLMVSCSVTDVIIYLRNSHNVLDTPKKLNSLLDALAEEGLLLNVRHADGRYQFQFKNEEVKKCLWSGGSILEMYVYHRISAEGNECRVGVHIDWDGVIHGGIGNDVLNEIDVLSLNGYVPTFVSCKTGKMDNTKPLFALYELETVARRFGGKYARKILVSAQPISGIYHERAEEMGIEIRQMTGMV